MKKTAVIYWSGTGNTKQMAEAVLEGMKSAGAEAALLEAYVLRLQEPFKRQEGGAVRLLRLGRRRMDAVLGKGL